MDYRIPPVTCPIIDRVRGFLSDAYTAAESLGEETDGGTVADVASSVLGDLERVSRELELVRRANAELRAAAEGYQEGYEETRKERDELEGRLQEQEEENRRLKAELIELGERFSF